ncbi:MAG: sigma-70 family RNA polymerase sigma factor [Thermoleophilaceae bacterium]
MHIETITAAATTEEALLLGRVAAGDVGEPLVDLYRRYSARLYGLGLKLLGERGMAEELVQETFLRLWRSAGRYDPERGSVRTFLFTIARRVAVDLLRRSASRPLSSQEHIEVIDDRSFDSLLLSLDVRDALGALSPKHRDVLELMLDEDLGQAEIAERLEIPLGTVKTRTFYGLRALRLELEERGLPV